MKFEIHSTNYDYDMAPWCWQKSEGALESLVKAFEDAKNISDTVIAKESIVNNLSAAIWHSTKLLAFSVGANWETNDHKLIIDNGYNGYEKLLFNYGLLKQTTQDEKYKLINSIEILLAGSRTPNRTLLHDLLNNNKNNSVALGLLSEDLESLTFGLIDWPEFVIRANKQLQKFKMEVDVEKLK